MGLGYTYQRYVLRLYKKVGGTSSSGRHRQETQERFANQYKMRINGRSGRDWAMQTCFMMGSGQKDK